MKGKKIGQLAAVGGFLLFILCLALRVVIEREFSFGWMVKEIFITNNIFYFVLAVVNPVIFLFFGKYIHSMEEQLGEQQVQFEEARKIMDMGKQVIETKNKELSTEAKLDDLTQLHNRKYVLRKVEKEIQTVKARKSIDPILFAMMIDVDNFKGINDTYGHAAGDLVLKDLAIILKRSIRGMDIIGRLGGDEFIIVLPETNGRAAKMVAGRVRVNVNSHTFRYGENDLHVRLSIGVTHFNVLDDTTSEMFLDKADQCLLEAKRSGKDQIIIS